MKRCLWMFTLVLGASLPAFSQSTPARAEVIAVLRKFNPTKIAVESDVYDKRMAKRYEDYLAGKHELTNNEIEQLGFRLAKELGHKTVYGADTDGDFPFQRVVNFGKASGR